MSAFLRATVLTLCLMLAIPALASDSPQFRGPHRDGIFPDTNLLQSWPEGGPPAAWTTDGIGAGYSAAAVANGAIYITGMLEDELGYLFALDESGAVKWKVAYGPETLDKQATGARATPTIDGDRVYVQSGLGVITCMSAADGKQIWQLDALQTFKGEVVSWAIAESLLVDGDLVFATPGGPDASVVALDKMTGKTVWTSKGFSEPSAYCSPVLFTFGGRAVVVTMTAKSVVGIDRNTGEVLWTHAHETDYDIHAVTPVCSGDIIYYTAGYGSGGGALKVSADGSSVTQLWRDENLDCQHHGVVLVDGYIYGTGSKNNALFCLELATGKVMWSSEEVSQGNTVYADGMLYIYEGPKSGQVKLVKASPAGFEQAGVLQIPRARDKHWANPTIANQRLYIRYNGSLYAFNIAR
ncbi:MAG: PQQ-like beta-propeller repeat protein [Candidatus Hydrogenedentes bacterium]|nr:PQQ-like beta-propeller repeat protein [Candidatus Hydrogenedentota bacterium]